jgi:hypothetical protein
MTYVSPTIKELDFEWASVVPLSRDAQLRVRVGLLALASPERRLQAKCFWEGLLMSCCDASICFWVL